MLTLASRSPQRRAILEQLGIEFRAEAPDAEELTEGDPAAVVIENARRKALSVQGERVLGADTAVVLDGRVFGKPADVEQAAEYLRSLAGRRHEVHGGLWLRERGEERSGHAVTQVSFRALEEHELEWYLATGEWRGRAGAYALQGKGAALVAEIAGDYWNVVGLPVSLLVSRGFVSPTVS